MIFRGNVEERNVDVIFRKQAKLTGTSCYVYIPPDYENREVVILVLKENGGKDVNKRDLGKKKR